MYEFHRDNWTVRSTRGCIVRRTMYDDNRWSGAVRRIHHRGRTCRHARGPDVLSDVAGCGSWQPSRDDGAWLRAISVDGNRRPLCRRVDTMRAGPGAPTWPLRLAGCRPRTRRLRRTRYKTDRQRSSARVLPYRHASSSSAMKWSVLVVLVVLVASTYASYVGPYRHYYVPGFQHTYVPYTQLEARFTRNERKRQFNDNLHD